MKDAAIRIRVEKELHTSFKAACHSENLQVSDVLRDFMRQYANQHQNGKQASLFAKPAQPRRARRIEHA